MFEFVRQQLLWQHQSRPQAARSLGTACGVCPFGPGACRGAAPRVSAAFEPRQAIAQQRGHFFGAVLSPLLRLVSPKRCPDLQREICPVAAQMWSSSSREPSRKSRCRHQCNGKCNDPLARTRVTRTTSPRRAWFLLRSRSPQTPVVAWSSIRWRRHVRHHLRCKTHRRPSCATRRLSWRRELEAVPRVGIWGSLMGIRGSHRWVRGP